MLKVYDLAGGCLNEMSDSKGDLRAAQWIDLSDASDHEKRRIEDALNVELSPVNDYEPFQVSSHFSATET